MATRPEDLKSGGLIMAPRVPHGLAAAVEGLTREVIRHRPDDIYVFAADHFEKLLELRDQYGNCADLPGRSNNTQTLREMNKAVKQREKGSRIERTKRELAAQSGWSLTETAKVLEKHRSIFGDSGRKISTEEIRALAMEKENKINKLSKETREVVRIRSKEELRKFEPGKHGRSSERYIRKSTSNVDLGKWEKSQKAESRGTPKIISQIPTLPGSTKMLAKDIKSELRKNRISSRERRSIGDKINDKGSESGKDHFVKSSRRSQESVGKDSEPRRRKKTEVTDNQKQKTDSYRSSRAMSMDRVKDFVVKRLSDTKSLEEIQSPGYVEKVQEVIDETAPLIREKVEELKLVAVGSKRSHHGYESVDESTSTSERSNKSNQTDDVRTRSAMSKSRKSRRSESLAKTSGTDARTNNDSLDGIETLASEPATPKTKEDGLETRLTETRNLLEGLSSAFSQAGERERVRRSRSAKGTRKNGSVSGESDVSEYLDVPKSPGGSTNLSLPAVRSASSRNASRSVSRSDSDNLVLPPISPEAPKSAKPREDLVLPILSPSGTAPSTTESKALSTPDVIDLVKTSREPETPELDENLLEDTPEVELNLPETEEVFKDSLNVTPEDAAEVPQRPDSLENDVNVDVNADVNVDVDMEIKKGTSDELKKKLIEIESVERNIENVLTSENANTSRPDEPGESPKMQVPPEENEKINEIFNIEDKLKEVEDSEKRISNILNSELPKDEDNINIRDKLREVEDTEKRIEDILAKEATKSTIIGNEEKNEGDKLEKEMQNNSAASRETTSAGEEILKIVLRTTAEAELDEELQNTSEIPAEVKSKPKDDVEIINCPKNQAEKQMEICKMAEEPVKNNTQSVEKLQNPKKYDETNMAEDDKRKEKKDDKTNLATAEAIPYSYILTEGSPCDIPDSVTTVIIPERPLQSSESETMEILLENGHEFDSSESKGQNEDTSALKTNELSSESKEDEMMKLKDIMDNFGEIVEPEVIECSTVDIDFIRGIKANHEIMISHQDLGEIKEEADKEVEEAEKTVDDVNVDKHGNTLKLENIQEKDEFDEVTGSREADNDLIAGDYENVENRVKGQDENLESPAEAVISTDGRNTDSDSTEVKETSITDGPLENTSENTPEIESIEPRSSESTNEVKETTITDRTLNGGSFEPGNNMPIVPELNLDSLQDITVSSFRMTDDESAKEASDTSRQESESTTSFVEPLTSDETKPDMGAEEIIEQKIVKTQVEIKEEPCEKVQIYTTGKEEQEVEEGTGNGLVDIEDKVSLEATTVTDALSEGIEVELLKNAENASSELERDTEDKNEDHHEAVGREYHSDTNTDDKIQKKTEVASEDIENLAEPNKNLEEDEAVEPDQQEQSLPVESSDDLKKSKDSTVIESEKIKIQEILSEQDEVQTDEANVIKVSSPPEAEVFTNNLDDDATISEKQEYHIYVPEVAGSQESTTTESSTFNSAATKIQAGVRGFLTRRRLQSAQKRSSTLDSVPSIQDSFAVDTAYLSPIEEVGLANAATTIQSNYRGYKARQRLRREDAVQKMTLSMENAFTENGLQHTGEFHDCIPLPVFDDLGLMLKLAAEGSDKGQGDKRVVDGDQVEPEVDGMTENNKDVGADESSASSSKEEGSTSDVTKSSTIAESGSCTEPDQASQVPSESLESFSERQILERAVGQIFMGQSSIPVVHVGMDQVVDFVMIAKDESVLQSRYLNFITSVEDDSAVRADSINGLDLTQSLRSNAGVESLPLDNPSNVSGGSQVWGPLALSDSSRGVIIEELPRSEEGSLEKTPVPYSYPETPETLPDAEAKPETLEEVEDPSLETHQLTHDSPVSFDDEHAFLESSPISLDDPTSPETSRVSSGRRNRSAGTSKMSLVGVREEEAAPGEEKKDSTEKEALPPLANLESELESLDPDHRPGESIDSAHPVDPSSMVPDASLATISFSMNVDDMLGFGEENEQIQSKRQSILEVTVTPRDLLKSSRSQESQLSGDRVESPVTMMQIVPKSVEEKSDKSEVEGNSSNEDQVKAEEAKIDNDASASIAEAKPDVLQSDAKNDQGQPEDCQTGQSKDSSEDTNEGKNLKENQITETKEQASPKENISNSPIESTEDTDESEKSPKTSSTEKNNTYSIHNEEKQE
ncbi:titin [Cephus cinctus]|uniref:Titin n=1 Tax=Cephus cinctus TaxID=211228 RepID=A0AAJ7BJH2_CEPCN|nr:titin [Cephus cinctus]XP_015587537.1 titin [Cephus cinctus]XP_015587547.1 titin [Cephus cinctus]XP_015587556.1 titin [Cephus cinctus]